MMTKPNKLCYRITDRGYFQFFTHQDGDMTTNNTTRYTIRTSCAQMPSSCWGEYRHVAVMELTPDAPADWEPREISDRSRYVKRIVKQWRNLNVDKTAWCAYQIALAEAAELIFIERELG